jgi:copper chaperone
VKEMGQTSETVIKIEGMSCGHCKMAVENALKEVAGVTNVYVDLDKKEAVVAGSASITDLHQAVEEAGYAVVA